jgi:Ca-activated chloride channel family protein
MTRSSIPARRCSIARTFGLVSLLAVAINLIGCSWGAGTPSTGATDLRILAGSEVRPLEPEILRAAQTAGVSVQIAYSGTLDMVDRINEGEPFDAILPPSGAYPTLALKTRPVAREKLFYSRVVLGVKQSRAQALGWDQRMPSWSDVTQAVRRGQLTYAMTNPTSSNTGMSALFAVAASVAGKMEGLRASEVNRQAMRDFLSGQKLTAGSSEWLADAYVREQDRLDGLVNYEAVLLRLNERPDLREKLTLIYPKEGVISADYPLLLLTPEKQAVYDRLVAALKAPAFQAGPVARAYLRPLDPTIPHAPGLSDAVVVELAFPNNLQVIDAVLASYQAELRRPATSIYLLDVSGSMRGQRIAGVKAALEVLSGLNPQGRHARYIRFQSRERVVLIPFSGAPDTPARFSFEDKAEWEGTEATLRSYIEHLHAGGGTAIYSALAAAYQIAGEERARDPERLVSVVLLTDGENNEGLTFEEFQRQWMQALLGTSEPVRTFPILFGEASVSELDQIASLTGGRSFDGRAGNLNTVFSEIRGYQ